MHHAGPSHGKAAIVSFLQAMCTYKTLSPRLTCALLLTAINFAKRGVNTASDMAEPFASILMNPSSYDPLSPSFDPGAASPCNPFPTTSPFLPVHFKRPLASSSLSLGQASFAVSEQPTFAVTNERDALSLRIPPAHSAPSLRRTKPCRFYLDAAGCKAGRWCNFKHPVGADSPSATLGSDCISRDWDNVPDVRDLDPHWGKQTDGELHPKFRTQPCRNFFLGRCRYGDKCQFIHPPGIITTQTSLQAPMGIPMELLSSATMPLYPTVVTPTIPTIPADAVYSKPSSKVPAREKKNVPCSAFEMDGECPHGSQCQFVHKPRTTAPRIRVQVKNNNDTPKVEKKGPEAVRKERVKPPKIHRSGAVKVVHGIHKPTWRVVGGGVRLANLPKRDDLPSHDSNVPDVSSQGSTTGSQSPMTLPSSPSPSTVSLPSPGYLIIDPSLADLSQYDFATPTRFPNHHKLLRAPSPDVPLDITMGSSEFYDLPVHRGPRKRTTMTGDDLIRQMREGSAEAHPQREKCRSKPQLTIYVPPLRKSRSSIDIVRGITPLSCDTRKPVAPDEMDPVAELSDDIDHALGWGEDLGPEEHHEKSHTESYARRMIEDIRRPHSTPPTPCSGYSVEVPLLPPLPAESP